MFGANVRTSRKLLALLAGIVATLLLVANVAGAVSVGGLAVAKVLSNVNAKTHLLEKAVSSTADHESAAQTSAADIPIDPSKGVILNPTAQSVTVGLPNATQLHSGMRLANGSVLYRGKNNADVVVIPTATGAQFLTVIHSKDAPEDYAYPAAIPQGGRMEVSSDGSAVLLDNAGRPIARIAPAWAIDAKQHKVATRFATNGSTLTQHIAHKASAASYPVVADPNVTFGPINFTL